MWVLDLNKKEREQRKGIGRRKTKKQEKKNWEGKEGEKEWMNYFKAVFGSKGEWMNVRKCLYNSYVR